LNMFDPPLVAVVVVFVALHADFFQSMDRKILIQCHIIISLPFLAKIATLTYVMTVRET